MTNEYASNYRMGSRVKENTLGRHRVSERREEVRLEAVGSPLNLPASKVHRNLFHLLLVRQLLRIGFKRRGCSFCRGGVSYLPRVL